jgi:hypothetical protein
MNVPAGHNTQRWSQANRTLVFLFVVATSFNIVVSGYLYSTKLVYTLKVVEPQTKLEIFGNDTKPTDSIKNSSDPVVLCYHQVRKWESGDSKNARTYIVPVDAFRNQMKILYDSGYRTVLPDKIDIPGACIPEKAFMLMFDDGTESQYINALPELDRYGFKAIFFHY